MKPRSLVPVLLAAAVWLNAATTKTWEMNTYQDYLKGRFQGISLSRDGQLLLAPRLSTVFSSGQPVLWSVARAPDGSLYLGTGHQGRVYRVRPSGAGKLIWTAEKPEVFAVAVDRRGTLYAATSPHGKVFRIKNGKATEFFNPGTTYIWSLLFAPDGTLYVGTGGGGKIFRVDAAGHGELYYETGQLHVTSLALDARGRLLAGTAPNGILYRISAKGKAFVVYDANLPEIHALTVRKDGTVYVAALGGSITKRTAAALAAPAKPKRVTAPATSITVRAAQGGIKLKPKPEKLKPATPAAAAAPVTPLVQVTGVETSALYRIHPDDMVDTLWSSTTENAYDLLVAGPKVLFSTDKHGRVYELDAQRKVTLLAQTNESEAVRLLPGRNGLLVATSNLGKIYRLGNTTGTSGTYLAPVHDAATVARWGRLSWRGEQEKGCRVRFETRAGNSARPDATWSGWSAPLGDAGGSQIRSPNAHYIQWRATFTGTGGCTPRLDSVTLAYLPQNSPPRVTSITVTSQATSRPAAAASSSTGTDSSPYSITVTASGEAGASTVSGTSTKKLARSISDRVRVSWQAEDVDGDRLVYSLYFRGAGEREWKLLKADLRTTSFRLGSDRLADGKYFFRVVASDRLANPPATAMESDRVSAPVLIDHTPPLVRIYPPLRKGKTVELRAEASDAASALRRCEYSLDAGPWIPLASDDGIIDSRNETFHLHLDNVPAGEHLVVVRAYDSAENAGLAKVVLR